MRSDCCSRSSAPSNRWSSATTIIATRSTSIPSAPSIPFTTLRPEKKNGNRSLASLVEEIERLDLLILALLLHDVGKAKLDDDHVSASLEVAMKVCRRFELPPGR